MSKMAIAEEKFDGLKSTLSDTTQGRFQWLLDDLSSMEPLMIIFHVYPHNIQISFTPFHI